jgi:hypothetical protein
MAAMQPYSDAEVSDVDFSWQTAFGLHSESHLPKIRKNISYFVHCVQITQRISKTGELPFVP